MLPQTALVDALDTGYMLVVQTLEFLPLGDDATSAVYRVVAQMADEPHQPAQTYLLKVKQGGATPASLAIPAHLHTNGLFAVVAPLPTKWGELAYLYRESTLILYPFIAGETGMDRGLTDREWAAFGRLMKAWHTYRLRPDLLAQLPRELFLSPHLATVTQLERFIGHHQFAAPHQQALIRFWQHKQHEINAICRRLRTLGDRLRQMTPPFVLCHADIHTANLLLKSDGSMAVIDWDGVMFAPKERDLIFVMARATVRFAAEQAFFHGYGGVTVDPLAFAYYRYEWVVQEIADYGSRVLLSASQPESNPDAVAAFQQLFAPDDVVAVAYATEQDLPDGLRA